MDFKKIVKCANCGKNFKRKMERQKAVLICSGFSNYGKEFCFYNTISIEEIEYTISKHFALLGMRIEGELREYINRIEVDKGRYSIYYVDGTVSIVDMTDDFGVKIKY